MIQEQTGVHPTEKFGFARVVQEKMPHLLLIWLTLSVLAPHQDLYKAFFHAIVIPAILILLASRCSRIPWRDPLLATALVFAAYAGISTFVVGLGPREDHVRALRWSVEVSFCLLALFLWMPAVMKQPRWWARCFLGLALAGAAAALLLYLVYNQGHGRLTGLGALHNPIQGSSILLVFFALGHFMLSQADAAGARDRVLVLLSLTAVALAVLLSESRAPIAAMLVYLGFVGCLELARRPRLQSVLIVLVVVAVVISGVLSLYGVDGYAASMLSRGVSYRLDIWQGYLDYPPESWWFGFGAGSDAAYLPAAELFWKPNRIPITHAHNLLIGTLAQTGILGLLFLSTLVALVVRAIWRSSTNLEARLRLLGILGLVFMLTLTGSFTVLSSIKAIWLFLWLPVIFIWFWARERSGIKGVSAPVGSRA